MKKRITGNSCGHDFEIYQIVKVDRIDNEETYKSNGWYFDNDDCEDFDDYKPGDKIKVAEDTYHHRQTGNLVTITRLTEGYCTDGSRSYMTEEEVYIPERDFDCYEGETYVNKQEETKTMKYKVGDKVKIVACKHGHGFDIGEVVRITEINPVNYRAEYLDGHDFWYVEDDDIEPANETTLITRPHDYTGCDPEIAEALKQGLEVYCEVWDDTYSKDENVRDWVTSYQKDDDWPYKNTETLFAYARPISQKPVQETKPKTKLVPKPASEIFAWLENPENGYKQTKDGKFWEKENEPTFTEKMVKYCGKDSLAGYDWHSKWLREVPVEAPSEPTQEPVSETSENPTQYSIGDIVEVTGHSYYHSFNIGNIVEIVAYDILADDYKCERQSDGKVQWLSSTDLKLVKPKPKTATVVEHQAAKLHLGNRVTIIRQDEVGNYLCEWGSGIRIWMQPEQIKFD